MLVLSRRPDERIVFPSLGILVQVVRVNGNTVRLGIEAPKDVRVIREEIAHTVDPKQASQIPDIAPILTDEASPPEGQSLSDEFRKFRHEIRNRLNHAILHLHLLQRQLELGQLTSAEVDISRVLIELQSVERDVDRQFGNLGLSDSKDSTEDMMLSPRRVLLVDDNRNEVELLSGYLRTFGFEVDVAHDGLEAIEYLAAREKPDIVLMDMQMPRLDGPATIRSIRENPALDGIVIFGISGLTPEEVGSAVGEGAVDRWFTKPISPQELVNELVSELYLPRQKTS